jgi:hypothetical protein
MLPRDPQRLIHSIIQNLPQEIMRQKTTIPQRKYRMGGEQIAVQSNQSSL